MVRETLGAFRVGFAERPTAEDWAAILRQLQLPPAQSADPLSGRVAPDSLDLPHWGRALMKHYARGGWVRHLSQRRHLRSRTPRAAREFETLHRLRAEGLPVPRPLLWAESGTLLTENWLVIAEIPRAQTLAEIARQDPARAEALLPAVAAVVGELVQRRLHHVDFHPGNVLINDEGQVFPIDFDKAGWLDGPADDLNHRYRQRWNRAITKHGLPTALEFSADYLSFLTR